MEVGLRIAKNGILTMKKSIVVSTPEAQFSAVVFRQDFGKSIEKVAKLGYQGVELAIRDPAIVDRKEIKKLVESFGLEVPAVGTGQAYGEEGLSFSSPNDGIRKKAVKRVKDHIHFASSFGAQVIIGLIRGKIEEGVGRKIAEEWALEATRECAKLAEECGIYLIFEPINRYETNFINRVEEAIEFLERLDEQNVRLLIDTFHMNIEEISIYQSIEKAKDHLTHVHFADSNRWAPGYGHLNFPKIVETLGGIDYKGYLSAEVLPLPNPDTAAKQAIEYLTGIDS